MHCKVKLCGYVDVCVYVYMCVYVCHFAFVDEKMFEARGKRQRGVINIHNLVKIM